MCVRSLQERLDRAEVELARQRQQNEEIREVRIRCSALHDTVEPSAPLPFDLTIGSINNVLCLDETKQTSDSNDPVPRRWASAQAYDRERQIMSAAFVNIGLEHHQFVQQQISPRHAEGGQRQSLQQQGVLHSPEHSWISLQRQRRLGL